MKYFLLLWSCLLIQGLNSGSLSAANNESQLFWGNGEKLTGTLESGTDQKIVWKSVWFQKPLEIQTAALSSIQFATPSEKSSDEADSFQIEMNNGDVLTGNLRQVTDKTLVFQSKRHGSFELQRDQILNMRRTQNSRILVFGPGESAQWKNLEGKAETAWRNTPTGHLTTSKSLAIHLPIKFPSVFEIELILETSSKPEVTIGLNKSPQQGRISLETWDDVLVATCGSQFVEVAPITADQRVIHVHLLLDQAQKKFLVVSNEGKQLAELALEGTNLLLNGLYLNNISGEMTLKYLRVEEWNGLLPETLKSQQHITTTAGKLLKGELVGLTEDGRHLLLQEAADSPAVEFSIKEISHVIFSEERVPNSASTATRLSWQNGGGITGQIAKIQDQQIFLNLPYAEHPIATRLDEIKQLKFPKSTLQQEAKDRLEFSGGKLSGELIFAETQSGAIHWLPRGGLNSSPLSASGKARFVRHQNSISEAENWNDFPQVLSLKNGDVLPCQLHKTTETTAHVSLPFSGVAEIPLELIQSLDLRTEAIHAVRGFDISEWQRSHTKIEITPDSVQFPTSGKLHHERIFTGNMLEFQIEWPGLEQFSAQIHLLGDDKSGKSAAPMFKLQGYQEHLSVQVVKQTSRLRGIQAAIFGNGGQVAVEGQSEYLPCPASKATFRFEIQGGELQLFINNKLHYKTEFDAYQITSKAFSISTNFSSAINRNTATGRAARQLASNNNFSGIILSNFQVRTTNRSVAEGLIRQDSREKTLTIPRFRRQIPPTHVLVAPNGDLLRGRLLKIEDKIVHFESQLETFQFGWDRVQMVVWLQFDSSETDETKSNKEPEIQLQLTGSYSISLVPESIQGEALQARSHSLGKCLIPVHLIREILLGTEDSTAGNSTSRWLAQHAPQPEWDLPATDSSSPASQLIGQKTTDFELNTLEGTPWKLSDHADKIVVLDFWATWCGPCVQALPRYLETTAEFDPQKVQFVAVNLRESPQLVRQFLAHQKLDPTVILDQSGEIAQQFQVSGIPHTVIISPGQIVEAVEVGYAPGKEDQMRDTLNQILQGTWKRPTAEPPVSSSPEKKE